MWVLGPPTFTHKTLIVGLMVVFFCHIFVVIIHPWFITTKIGPLLHYLVGGRINLSILVMIDVVFILKQPISTSQQVDLGIDRYYGGFGNLSIIVHHPPCSCIGVGIIQLVLLLVIRLVLLLVMSEVVWVLGPITLTPIKMIVGYMVTCTRIRWECFLRICNKTIMYQAYIRNSWYYLWQPLVESNGRR